MNFQPPVSEAGTAAFFAADKAILFMCYGRTTTLRTFTTAEKEIHREIRLAADDVAKFPTISQLDKKLGKSSLAPILATDSQRTFANNDKR